MTYRLNAVLGIGALSLSTLALIQAAPAQAAAGHHCHGQRATIVGTSRADTLTGTRHRDVIVGRGGDDVIKGLKGDDIICGGYGADTLLGNAGDDRLYGQGNAIRRSDGDIPTYFEGDTLDGGAGSDLISTGRDDRTADGVHGGGFEKVTWARSPHGIHLDIARGTASGWGHDRIETWTAGGTVYTTSGHADDVTGSSRADRVVSGTGADTVVTGGGADLVDLGSDGADDFADTGSGGDKVTTQGVGHGVDRIRTGGTFDSVFAYAGGGARVHVSTGGGDDLLYMGPGPGSTFVAGAGTNRGVFLLDPALGDATFDAASGVVTYADGGSATTSGLGPVQFQPAGVSTTTLHYSGTAGADELISHIRLDATMLGGDDHVTGSQFDDTIDGGDGTDYADGGLGADTCTSVEQGPC
ncbi:MAG: calcium-binding protein [Nocardioides sp.]